ncbi:MAG TPA: SPOR domain-containing protein [archaeon]|nr:SPOR domain-containing protein [archaeon]
MDSLWLAPLPVDTVVLQERARVNSGAPAVSPERRRGPSSAQVGSVDRVWGYRVQLASAEKKEELQTLCLRVEREFGTTAYLEKLGGRYCLRVGDYLDKTEAEEQRLRAVSFGFKHAWIVQALIFFTENQNKE